MRFLACLSSFFLAALLLSGCTSNAYRGAMQATLAHRTVAVLPFEVSLLRLQDAIPIPGQWRDTADRRSPLLRGPRAERYALGSAFQHELHLALLRRQARRPSQVVFQDVDETNRRLASAGVTPENLSLYSMPELKTILGVDAVFAGRAVVRQPLPGAVNVALLALGNGTGIGLNGSRAALNLYDAASGQLVWHCEHELRGQLATDPTLQARALVRGLRKVYYN